MAVQSSGGSAGAALDEKEPTLVLKKAGLECCKGAQPSA